MRTYSVAPRSPWTAAIMAGCLAASVPAFAQEAQPLRPPTPGGTTAPAPMPTGGITMPGGAAPAPVPAAAPAPVAPPASGPVAPLAQTFPVGADTVIAPMPIPSGGRAMAPGEVDQAIEGIFRKAREIKYFEAQLVTELYDSDTPDSAPRNKKESYGFLRLSTPNLMWIQDYGEDEQGRPRTRRPRENECSYMIVNGQFFYDIQAPMRRGEKAQGKRERLADYVAAGQAANIAAVLGMYLGLEREVTTAAELRADFVLEGAAEPVAWKPGVPFNHFRLTPRRPDADFVIELWHQPGTALPERVSMIEKKKIFRPGQRGQDTFVYRHTERAMNDAKTNLDGLRPFGENAFAVPRIPIEWEDEAR